MTALESTLSKRVSRTQHEKSLPITCLVWNPQMNGELAYADDQVSAALIIIIIVSTRGRWMSVLSRSIYMETQFNPELCC